MIKGDFSKQKRSNGMDKREKLGIPKYTLGEELVNSISHGLGAVFGIVALVLCVVFSARQGDVWRPNWPPFFV